VWAEPYTTTKFDDCVQMHGVWRLTSLTEPIFRLCRDLMVWIPNRLSLFPHRIKILKINIFFSRTETSHPPRRSTFRPKCRRVGERTRYFATAANGGFVRNLILKRVVSAAVRMNVRFSAAQRRRGLRCCRNFRAASARSTKIEFTVWAHSRLAAVQRKEVIDRSET
jgi:hypothetical protein